MRKGRKITVSLISVALLLSVAAVCAFPQNVSQKNTESRIYTVAVNAAESGEKTEAVAVAEETAVKEKAYTEEELWCRFLSMLNMNYSYFDTFENEDELAVAAAVTLKDYAIDVDGVSGVSAYLVAGFIKEFYGIELDAKALSYNGYVLLPSVGTDTVFHKPYSFSEENGRITVFTGLEEYAGGDDYEERMVKSVFVKNPQSDFGFNLVECEIL